MEDINYSIAVFIARMFLGILFLLQGYDKVFRIGLKKTAGVFRTELATSGFPPVLITFAAYCSSLIELFGGILLIYGFMKSWALYALGLDLLLVAVALGWMEPLWKMDSVFPRLALVLFLLLVPPSWDCWSLDAFFGIVKPITH